MFCEVGIFLWKIEKMVCIFVGVVYLKVDFLCFVFIEERGFKMVVR